MRVDGVWGQLAIIASDKYASCTCYRPLAEACAWQRRRLPPLYLRRSSFAYRACEGHGRSRALSRPNARRRKALVDLYRRERGRAPRLTDDDRRVARGDDAFLKRLRGSAGGRVADRRGRPRCSMNCEVGDLLQDLARREAVCCSSTRAMPCPACFGS